MRANKRITLSIILIGMLIIFRFFELSGRDASIMGLIEISTLVIFIYQLNIVADLEKDILSSEKVISFYALDKQKRSISWRIFIVFILLITSGLKYRNENWNNPRLFFEGGILFLMLLMSLLKINPENEKMNHKIRNYENKE